MQEQNKAIKIYGLFDPRNNELRYVGKTNNTRKRFSKHVNDKVITHKTCWIKSLSKLGLKPEIYVLDEIPSNEWKFWEQWYISYFLGLGCRLTNDPSVPVVKETPQ